MDAGDITFDGPVVLAGDVTVDSDANNDGAGPGPGARGLGPAATPGRAGDITFTSANHGRLYADGGREHRGRSR